MGIKIEKLFEKANEVEPDIHITPSSPVMLSLTIEFMKRFNPQKVLEPYTHIAEITAHLAESFPESNEMTCILRSRDYIGECLKSLFPNQIRYFAKVEQTLDYTYDFMVCDMPRYSMGNPKQADCWKTLDEGLKTVDRAIIRLYEFSKKLSDEGYMLLAFSRDTLRIVERKDEIKWFERRRLFVNGVIEIPENLTVLILSRKEMKYRFFKSITSPDEAKSTLDEFFQYVDKGEQSAFWVKDRDSLCIAQMEYNQAQTRTVYPMMLDVVKEIQMKYKRGKWNAIYIPAFEMCDVVASMRKTKKEVDYIQVVCIRDKVNRKKLIQYLNSEKGRKIRYLAQCHRYYAFNDFCAVHMSIESLLAMEIDTSVI